ESGCGLPAREQERIVPRRDRPHDAVRLADRIDEVAVVGRMRAPVRQLSMAGEVGEEICAQLDLGRGLRQRLARVTRLDLADGVRVLADQVGEAPQDTSPLAGRGL